MKMFAAKILSDERTEIDGDSVQFVTADGRIAFEVLCGEDNRTIEIRSGTTFKWEGKILGPRLSINPKASNVIHVTAREFDED